MFKLEGVRKIKDPTLQDIKEELSNLQKKEAEFVILSKGKTFLQAINSDSPETDSYYLEAHLPNGESYKSSKPLDSRGLLTIFTDFFMGKIDFKNLKEWIAFNEESPKMSKRYKIFLITFLIAIYYAMVIFAGVMGPKVWSALLLPATYVLLFIIPYLLGLFSLYPWLTHKFIPKTTEALSNWINMPSDVVLAYRSYRIVVKNKNTRNAFKIFILHIVLFVLAAISITLILLWLSVIVLAYWYFDDKTDFLLQWENFKHRF